MSPSGGLRLGVLGSGKGSNLHAIFRAIDHGRVVATVGVILSDVPDAGILQIGRSRRVRAEYVCPGASKARLDSEGEQAMVTALEQEDVELVVLAGFMRIVGPRLLAAFPRRIINVHPSLLPKYPGLRAWEQALTAQERMAGCTVHYVDEGVDTGEIIAQSEVGVMPNDSAQTLHYRIQEAEHVLYPEVIGSLARQGISKVG